MATNPITRDQADVLRQQVASRLRYLGRLRDRLVANGYTPGDELLRLTTDAYDKVHALHVAAHYAGCDPRTVGQAGEQASPASERRQHERRPGQAGCDGQRVETP